MTESRFSQEEVKLLDMRPGQERSVEFHLAAPYTAEQIRRVTPSCGCTKVRLREREGIIAARIKAGDFPAHLRGNGMYNTRKYIRVDFEDGERVNLSIYMEVHKP